MAPGGSASENEIHILTTRRTKGGLGQNLIDLGLCGTDKGGIGSQFVEVEIGLADAEAIGSLQGIRSRLRPCAGSERLGFLQIVGVPGSLVGRDHSRVKNPAIPGAIGIRAVAGAGDLPEGRMLPFRGAAHGGDERRAGEGRRVGEYFALMREVCLIAFGAHKGEWRP